MTVKIFIVFLMMFLLPARIWAVSWAQTLSSKENIAKFCFRDIKGSSLDLEIKHNIDIVLPLFEINKYIEYNEMWHGQIDLSEILNFPIRSHTIVESMKNKLMDENLKENIFLK